LSASAAATLFWSSRSRVFDLDGTLVDTLPDLHAALNLALQDLQLPAVDRHLVQASLHEGLEGSARAALLKLRAPVDWRPLLLERYELHYKQVSGTYAMPYPGVHGLLDRLVQIGERPAVCTNKSEARAIELLARLGLIDAIVTVVGADTCSHRKPHPEPLLHALTALRAEPEASVLIGDSSLDVQCAAAAQVPCIFFASGYGTLDHAPQGPVRFSDYRELLDHTA
jgi:2-phosphoglycolate phosphatase